MIPATYVMLDALPLTANGKVDRKALPIPDLSMEQRTVFVPPRNDTEQSIADIWSELLELEQVGIHDDFFALGGDSLITTQLRTRLRDKTQIDLPLRTFFEKNTIANLANHIEANMAIDRRIRHSSKCGQLHNSLLEVMMVQKRRRQIENKFLEQAQHR